MTRCGDLQRVGGDQQVCVVEQGHLGNFHQHNEDELDDQHEDQLADAADVQEHGAGQQGQHHAVAEILHRRRDGHRSSRRLDELPEPVGIRDPAPWRCALSARLFYRAITCCHRSSYQRNSHMSVSPSPDQYLRNKTTKTLRDSALAGFCRRLCVRQKFGKTNLLSNFWIRD